MKKYVYNLFCGSYDCPVFMHQQVLSFYLGQSYVTRKEKNYPSVTWVLVKEVDSDD